MTVKISNFLPSSHLILNRDADFIDIVAKLQNYATTQPAEQLQKSIKHFLRNNQIGVQQLWQELSGLLQPESPATSKIKYVFKNLYKQEQLDQALKSLSEQEFNLKNEQLAKLKESQEENSQLKDKITSISKETSSLKLVFDQVVREKDQLKTEVAHLRKENNKFFERLILNQDYEY